MAPTRKLPKPLTLNREAALSTDLVVEMVRSACLKRGIAVQLLVWSGRVRVSIQLLLGFGTVAIWAVILRFCRFWGIPRNGKVHLRVV